MKQTNKRMMSMVFTLTIVALLYFSGPSTAITAALGAIADVYRGQLAAITGSVTLNDYEFIMNSGTVILTIDTASNGSFNCTLPKVTGSVNVTCSNNQNISVLASSSNWDYSYGYGYDYGYAYSPYTYSYQYGYGYEYGSNWLNTVLSYNVLWRVPRTYDIGGYTATIHVYADNTLVDSSTAQAFTVNRPVVLINEILANPSGAEPDTEFIELYNTENTTANITGWTLGDGTGTIVNYSLNGTISGQGFKVYFGAETGITLNNAGDTVYLYDTLGAIVDEFTWSSDPGQGISFVRSANGGDTWTTTDNPSPGTTNEEVAFAMSLEEVWNLVSIPVTLSNQTPQSTLSSIADKYTIVWGYNASDTGDPWKKYVPGAAIGNDLAAMTPEWGYWIRVNSTSATLNVSGEGPTTTDIALVDVWNLVGFPSLTAAANVSAALSTIDGNYTIVWAYNATDTGDPWKKHVPGAAIGNDLAALTPGYGLWIRANVTSETLTI
ncbi:MAG: lamin tail domain-containing protein [Methanobacteriota archaeon]